MRSVCVGNGSGARGPLMSVDRSLGPACQRPPTQRTGAGIRAFLVSGFPCSFRSATAAFCRYGDAPLFDFF